MDFIEFVSERKKYVLAVVLFLLSVVLYEQSFTNDFVWDANVTITRDMDIRDFSKLPGYFTHDFFSGIERDGQTETFMVYYRPVLKIIHLFEYQLFGQNPIGYNVVNIVLNALIASAVFFVLAELSGNLTVATLSAALFAVNPSHVEAVSWAYSDSYMMAMLLCLGSFYAYHKNKNLLALALLSPALLIHELALQAVVAFAFYEMTINRKPGNNPVRRLLPFVVINFIYLAVRYLVVPRNVPQGLATTNPILSSIVILQRYVRIFFQPDALITLYPVRSFHFSNAELLCSVMLCILAAAVAAFLVRYRLRHELFWFGWFFIWLIIPLAAILVGNLGDYCMMDKSLYFASLGFCGAIAYAATSFAAYPNLKRILFIAAGLLIVYHAGYTFARTRYWKNNITYFEKAYEFEPDFYALTSSLGIEYATKGDIPKAQQLFLQACRLNPNNSMIFANLGNTFLLTGDINNAKMAYERSVRLDATNSVPFYNLGLIFEKEGNKAEALKMYHRYLELTPQVPEAIRNQIRMLESTGN